MAEAVFDSDNFGPNGFHQTPSRSQHFLWVQMFKVSNQRPSDILQKKFLCVLASALQEPAAFTGSGFQVTPYI